NDEVHSIYRDDLAGLAAYLRDHPTTQALVSTTDTGLDPLLFEYDQPPKDARVSFFNGQTDIVLSTGDQPALLFISPLSSITPPHADWLISANGTSQLEPLYRNDGKIAYNVYQLNAVDALQTRLSQVQAQPVYIYNESTYPRGAVAKWAQSIDYPVNFGDVVQLVGVDLAHRDIASEQDGVNIQLYFQPLIERVDLPLNVFVHMSRLDGAVHAQRDLLGVPTLQWERDLTFIQDNFVIAGKTDPGRYIITMGIYNYLTGERLPVLDAYGNQVADHVVVDRVTVVRK
ncbi:MAG TPA: hypothetical protein VHL11_25170, partial [Phototrophicaceae bacterium]|nr:hypothetical protein [Phototrophicaceae bacterium]